MDADQNQKKILIAEDEEPIAKAMELKLTASGFNVTVAKDGQQALDKIMGQSFDLVVLDLVMPVMDGFTVLTEMKAKKNATPVIVASNLSQEEDIARARDLGAAGYYIKSDTPLASIVQQIIDYFSGS